MGQNVVIYNDEGVGEFGLKCLQQFFKDHDVWLASAEAIIDGRVLDMADIFVMPGGADLPYCKKLNGMGNDNIRSYVEEGGTYLGICAGAYYACKALEFHKGRADEISGSRELGLADATAYGSLPDIAPYYDLTLKCAAIANIKLTEEQTFRAFYQGGPAFFLHNMGNVLVHAHYADIVGKPPAIIETTFGKGRAILTGVHLEVSAQNLVFYPLAGKAEEEQLKILEAGLVDLPSSHHILHHLIGINN